MAASSSRVTRVADGALPSEQDGRTGVAVVVLDTGAGGGRKTFFDAVRASVSLNPPVVSERSWDALSDSLWQGLWEIPGRAIEIRWLGGSTYERVDPDNYAIALDVLTHVAESLARADMTSGAPKDVRVLLI